MRKLAAIAAVIWLAAASSPAQGQGAHFLDGNDLAEICEDDTSPKTLRCIGYVTGVADLLTDHPVIKGVVCIPKEVIAKQVVDVAKLYLESHPEMSHAGAAVLLSIAFAEAFPCQ